MRRYHPQTTVVQQLAPGFVLLLTPESFDNFTAPWRQRLPIYLHHVFPVQATVPLETIPSDLNRLKQAVQPLASPHAIVQLRSATEVDLPYSLTEIQYTLNEKQPAYSADKPIGRILSILIAPRIAPQTTGLQAYIGVSWATENLSPWAGGQIPITECVPNRAGFKLLEALHAFDIRLRQGDHALDLGAAPGAWTTLLRRRGVLVTAVAPSPLYPWLLFDNNVRYQPLRAEDFLAQCQATYDLIVNDMKLDAQESARLMVRYATHLRSQGIAIMTVKLRDRNRQRVLDHSFRILRKAYKIIRVRQLVSNRQEVTLFLRRKS